MPTQFQRVSSGKCILVNRVFLCYVDPFSGSQLRSVCRMLVPNKMQHVICTGNVGVDQYNELLELAPNVHIVAGDYEDASLTFPDSEVVRVGHFKIGVIHGHQILPYGSNEALARTRRKLGVDILISGFSHQNEVSLQDGFYYINPVGSTVFHW